MSLHDCSDNLLYPEPGLGLDQYFFDISVDCPYGLDRKAVYHQAQLSSLPDETMNLFLKKGYRRNGNYIYTMRCPGCNECTPIRLRPGKFMPRRSQKRVWKKNRDVTVGVAPLSMSKENLDLLDKFLEVRFPQSKTSAFSYYTGIFLGSLSRSLEIRYRIDERLLGTAIIDASTDWLNAVYFYFDPEESHRSPGIYNILTLINFCSSHTIDYLYLGYWIKWVASMSYKRNFLPHELLVDGSWVPFCSTG